MKLERGSIQLPCLTASPAGDARGLTSDGFTCYIRINMLATIGRPSTYSQEIADEICRRLMAGRSLTKVAADEDMPGLTCISEWLFRRNDFAAQYARAVEVRADVLIEQTHDIADDTRIGYITEETVEPDGSITRKVKSSDMVERSKLMVSTRQWGAARMNPRKYSDRLAHQYLGKDGQPSDAPATVTVIVDGAGGLPGGMGGR